MRAMLRVRGRDLRAGRNIVENGGRGALGELKGGSSVRIGWGGDRGSGSGSGGGWMPRVAWAVEKTGEEGWRRHGAGRRRAGGGQRGLRSIYALLSLDTPKRAHRLLITSSHALACF
ncbi:hypothetical protein CALVIDRAFT_27900 [Calocera viscosa TUFC12733]|uniref:Uncharacterized protein n=1 Tax=Calocera viscosa (strain TUFC12733) TaxID=1330018 RepID=A0A167P9U3_CALVF|nr:hypothetical protein CALVIDRAFT_27900 [Calocera viscosa TUFC12733]